MWNRRCQSMKNDKADLPHGFGQSHSAGSSGRWFTGSVIGAAAADSGLTSGCRRSGKRTADGSAAFGPSNDPLAAVSMVRIVGRLRIVEIAEFAGHAGRRAGGPLDDHVLDSQVAPTLSGLAASAIGRRPTGQWSGSVGRSRSGHNGRSGRRVGGCGRRIFGVDFEVSVKQVDDGDDEQQDRNGKAVNEFSADLFDVEVSDGQSWVHRRVEARKVVAHHAVGGRKRVVTLHIRRISATFDVGLQTSSVLVQLDRLIRQEPTQHRVRFVRSGQHGLQPVRGLRLARKLRVVVKTLEVVIHGHCGRCGWGSGQRFTGRNGRHGQRNGTLVADADVPTFENFFGATFAARAPVAVGEAAQEIGLDRFAGDGRRIEIHVQRCQSRFDEERHQEQERKQTEHGQQHEEGRRIKQDRLPPLGCRITFFRRHRHRSIYCPQ